MKLIDAEMLEQDGWSMSRTIQVNEKTMEVQTKKPTDFSAIEPRRGKWMKWEAQNGLTNGSECSECGYITSAVPNYGTKFCPNCGARMSEELEPPHTMEEFMYGQDLGNPEDGSL